MALSTEWNWEKLVFKAGIILIAILTAFMFVWQTYYFEKYEYGWGYQEDSKYYVDKLKEPISIKDYSHWNILILFKWLGFPFVNSAFLVFCVWLASFAYFSTETGLIKACYGAFLLTFASAYFIWLFYVNLWSQCFSFLFFIMMLFWWKKKEHGYEITMAIISGIIHPMTTIISLVHFILTYDFKNKKILLMGALLFLYFGFYWYLAFGLNLLPFISTYGNDVNPPVFYTLVMMMNPFMLGTALNSKSPHYLVFFLLALVGHNGRITMYFSLFLVLEHVRRLETKQAWLISLLCNGLYFIFINGLFINELYSRGIN